MSFYVVIPARLASSRLPDKPLKDIGGKPMIQHVYERAKESLAKQVIVATDSLPIKEVIESFGGMAHMTSQHHNSGTDRLQQVVQDMGLAGGEIVVNVQGDEPLIPPTVINQVAKNLAQNSTASVATLCEPITTYEHFFDPNIVKVVTDRQSIAMYFSRAPIPWFRDEFSKVNISENFLTKNSDKNQSLPPVLNARRHIGIYAYHVDLLHRFISWPLAPLEKLESLEQLRMMWQGEKIHVDDAVCEVPGGVDTQADLARVRAVFEAKAN